MQNSPSVLVPIGQGFEELETITIVDILRRAQATVVLASVMGKDAGLLISGQQGIIVKCDDYIENIINNDFTLITLPGGLNNAQILSQSQILIDKLKKQKEQQKLFSAICASPAVVLNKHNLIANIKATGYPSFQQNNPIISYQNEAVVFDKNCITSQGPGTAAEFAIKLVQILFNKEKAQKIAQQMLIKL